MKYIRDEEQCKDVAQETLLTYWQNRADFEDIFKVKGYLYRVARNRCLNMIRREQVDEHFVKEALTESEAYFENEVIRQETYLLVRKEGTVHTLKKTAYKKLRDRLQEHFYLLLFWI